MIVFSWVFELTPEGLQRTRDVDPAQSITPLTSRRLDYVIIALLLVAIGFFAAERFLPRSDPPGVAAGSDESVGRASARQEQDVGLKPDLQADAQPDAARVIQPAATLAPDDKSIAVLPFVNMSSDKEQEYFSDGMAEELLNLLAKAPDLKVIARTSSFAFKGKDVPIAEIARRLNVAHVLEGSVRKAGNTVRITAQLIRTADSTHLWSETYDRPLDDVFAVQDEIANAIVQALQIKLAGGTLSRREGGTQNLGAYQLYLKGLSAERQNTNAALQVARDCLDRAIKLDPAYGMAWTRLAYVNIELSDSAWLPPAEGYEQGRKLARQALTLSPDIAAAHGALMHIHHRLDWDWAAAESEGRRAIAIEPMNPDALNSMGLLAISLGQWDDAGRWYRAALIRDPLNSYLLFNLGSTHYFSGDFDEAERVYRQLLVQEPDFGWVPRWLGKVLLADGRFEEALAMVRKDTDEASRLKLLPIVLFAAGKKLEANEALQAQLTRWSEHGAFWIALTHAYLGDRDRAMEWLDRAYLQKDSSLVDLYAEPLIKNLAPDPRFQTFLRKMNLPTEPVPVNWQ